MYGVYFLYMSKKDLYAILAVGGIVGLLAQPVLQNVIVSILHRPADFLISFLVWLVFFVGAPVALYVCLFLSRYAQVAYQFGKFAAVGVLNTFVDLGVFNLLALPILSKALVLTQLQFVSFKAVSFVAANINSYFWNSRWTFSNPAGNGSSVIGFYVVSLLGFVVNLLIAWGTNFTLLFLHVSPSLAANGSILCAVVASMVFNFVGYKYFVFAKK